MTPIILLASDGTEDHRYLGCDRFWGSIEWHGHRYRVQRETGPDGMKHIPHLNVYVRA